MKSNKKLLSLKLNYSSLNTVIIVELEILTQLKDFIIEILPKKEKISDIQNVKQV